MIRASWWKVRGPAIFISEVDRTVATHKVSLRVLQEGDNNTGMVALTSQFLQRGITRQVHLESSSGPSVTIRLQTALLSMDIS